jgi:hypothetical protein
MDSYRNRNPLNASIARSNQGLISPFPKTAWFITSWANAKLLQAAEKLSPEQFAAAHHTI